MGEGQFLIAYGEYCIICKNCSCPSSYKGSESKEHVLFKNTKESLEDALGRIHNGDACVLGNCNRVNNTVLCIHRKLRNIEARMVDVFEENKLELGYPQHIIICESFRGRTQEWW